MKFPLLCPQEIGKRSQRSKYSLGKRRDQLEEEGNRKRDEESIFIGFNGNSVETFRKPHRNGDEWGVWCQPESFTRMGKAEDGDWKTKREKATRLNITTKILSEIRRIFRKKPRQKQP